MPAMSAIEAAFCRSGPWRLAASHVVLPWALRGHDLHGEVLELGSGSGAMAAVVLRRYPATHLTATDVDDEMLASLRRRLARFGTRVAVRSADATQLTSPDGAFDAVVSFLMLHHLLDWEAAIDQVRRVLRPGGCFVGYDLTDSGVARVVHRLDRSAHRLVRPADLESRLRGRGFRDVRVSTALAGHVMRFAAATPSVPPDERQRVGGTVSPQ